MFRQPVGELGCETILSTFAKKINLNKKIKKILASVMFTPAPRMWGKNIFFEVVLHHLVPIVTLVKKRSEGAAFGLVHNVCLTPYAFVIDKGLESELVKEVRIIVVDMASVCKFQMDRVVHVHLTLYNFF